MKAQTTIITVLALSISVSAQAGEYYHVLKDNAIANLESIGVITSDTYTDCYTNDHDRSGVCETKGYVHGTRMYFNQVCDLGGCALRNDDGSLVVPGFKVD